MRSKNVGAIVVLASDTPTGILTDRDLAVAVVADAKDPTKDKHGALVGIMALDDMMMLLGDEMAHVASALSRELGRPHTLAVT